MRQFTNAPGGEYKLKHPILSHMGMWDYCTSRQSAARVVGSNNTTAAVSDALLKATGIETLLWTD